MVDLYRSGFDPALLPADEPDWSNAQKQYSDETERCIAASKHADALVYVFPVWWYSVPAMLKGYIDRVWNYGHFYGGGERTGLGHMLWIGLAGQTREDFAKREYEAMMQRNLNVGIAGLCGIEDSKLELLYNTLGSGVDDAEAHVAKLRAQARSAAANLAKQVASDK